MRRHSKRLSVVKCLYDAKNVNPRLSGISVLHNASKPTMSNHKKVTFREKLLFSVVIPGVVSMQLSHSTTDIVLAKDSMYLKAVSFPRYSGGEVK